MELVNVNIADIVPYESNPRKNDQAVDIVMKSIKEYGFLVPVILDDKNIIVAGHTRIKAAIKLGMTEVPVIYTENLTDAQIKAFRIMDNKTHEYAEWDMDLLKQEIISLSDMNYNLDLTGFNDAEIDDITGREPKEDDFEIPNEPRYKIETGEIWQLGEHRLLCGDSTNKEAVDKLMNNQKADMVLTDPPYNVAYTGGPPGEWSHKKHRKILNDELSEEDWSEFIERMFKIIFEFNKGAIYVCMSCKELPTITNKFKELGGHYSTFVIWHKTHFTLSKSDYQREYEPILYGWKEGEKHYFVKARNLGDVWTMARPMKSDLHPTMKPIELCSRAIKNSSQNDNIVLDLFGGSGSTLIACEQTDRKCYMMELDKFYCSVIIERWEKITGKNAKKIE